MKRTLSVLLCLCMIIALVPMMTAQAAETISYTAYEQGVLENVAAGKTVRVSTVSTVSQADKLIYNGKNLTDERDDSYWESKVEWAPEDGSHGTNRNLNEGAVAVINLGATYPIYRIEVVAEKAALQNYRVVGFDYSFGNWDYEPSIPLLYNNEADGNNSTVHAAGEKDFGTKTTSTWDQKGLAVAYANLHGEKASVIRFEKTAAEAAKIAEIRVYSIVPKLIEVTPRTADKLWTNGEVDASYPLERIVDNSGKDTTNMTLIRKPSNSNLLINMDLGQEYYIRRAEYWFRQAHTEDFRSRKGFGFWVGNDTLETDYTVSGVGKRIGSVDAETGLFGATVSFDNVHGLGGSTMIFDHEPTEATRYATFAYHKNYGDRWYSMGEVKIYAEDRTATQMEITNVADFDAKTVNETNGYVTIDLGAYHNVKKIAVSGNSGAFKIVGTSTEVLTYDEAILAASPTGFDGEAEYDVKLQNIVRYITFMPKEAGASLTDLKVYAEAGKTYENIAQGKTATGNGASAVVNTAIVDGNVTGSFISGNFVSKVSTAITPENTINIDLGNSKKINALSITFRKDNEVKIWERRNFQVWGSNSADLSDKELITVQGSRTAATNNVWTMMFNNAKAYRYITISAYANAPYAQTASPYGIRYFSGKQGSTVEYDDTATYYWMDGETNRSERKVEKVWQEIQVYTEKLDVTDAAYGKAGSLTDGNAGSKVDLADAPIITLDRHYPISYVELGAALAADVMVEASNDGVAYTPVGTIAAGATELSLNNASYRYIKLSTASSDNEVAEIYVYVENKYYGKDLLTTAFAFENAADGTGAPINDLSSSVLGVDITVKNIAPEAQDAVVILGLFDANNNLLDVAVSNTANITSGNSATLFTGITTTGKTYTVDADCYLKAFVWESLSTINPLTGAQSLANN